MCQDRLKGKKKNINWDRLKGKKKNINWNR